MVAQDPPHLRALSATSGLAMVESSPRAQTLAVTARSLRSMADSHRPPGTSNLSPGLSTSPSLSTVLGGSVAAHVPS